MCRLYPNLQTSANRFFFFFFFWIPTSLCCIPSLSPGLNCRPHSSPSTSHLSTGSAGCEVCQALSVEDTIRKRGVGTKPQKPARRKTHTVIRTKNPKHVMGFTSSSWFYSHPLQHSTFTVKETAQIIMLPLP